MLSVGERFTDVEQNRLSRRSRVAGLTLACAAVFILSSALANSWAAPEAGYVFSNMVVQPREGTPDVPGGRPDFTVGYATAWTGDEFPGWRACVVRVVGDDGTVIGEKTIRMFDVTRAPSSRSTEVEVLPGAERRRPERVLGDCAGPRLDDVNGYYELSDVRIRRDPIAVGDQRTFELSFDETWVGAGVPGVQTCNAVVKDDSGSQLFVHRFNFTDGMGGRDDATVRIITDEPVDREPAAADLGCGPFSP